MRLWHAWVGNGRFIVRAKDEKEAISLARSAAREYVYPPEEADVIDAGADLLDTDGNPEVLDIDYS